MLKLISGKKGSGKTKHLISMVNEAAKNSSGKVVCIDRGTKLTFDIDHNVRLLNVEEYDIFGCDSFLGFLAGIVASDFDVRDIFIDSIGKIIGDNLDSTAVFIQKLEELSNRHNLNLYVTISHDQKELPEKLCTLVALNLA